MPRVSRWGLVALVVALEACEGADARPAGDVASREQVENGWQLNGWQLNGWQVNGWQLNGWQLNGWQLNGVALEGLSLSGTLFSGVQTIDGVATSREGLDFVGATFTAVLGEFEYSLRIDDIAPDPGDPTGEVYFYRVSVYDPEAGTWSSLCKDGSDAPLQAIPLAGRWDMVSGDFIDDPAAVTLACRGAVLAKCVEFGYHPWSSAKACKQGKCTAVPLRDHHLACTRMLRADYCGDGHPHTLAGTPIDVYDGLTPPIQEEGTKGMDEWEVEAEWGPDGALCVGEPLRLKMLESLGVPHDEPGCIDALLDLPACGSLSPRRGAKLANKYCPFWIDDLPACGGEFEGEEED